MRATNLQADVEKQKTLTWKRSLGMGEYGEIELYLSPEKLACGKLSSPLLLALQ